MEVEEEEVVMGLVGGVDVGADVETGKSSSIPSAQPSSSNLKASYISHNCSFKNARFNFS